MSTWAQARHTQPHEPHFASIGMQRSFAALMGVIRGLVTPRIQSTNTGSIQTLRGPHRSLRRNGLSQKTSTWYALFFIVLRLVVALTAVQITGIPHVAVDLIEAVQSDDDHEHEHQNCPNDDDGRECPPGCPSCHCTHAMNALLAAPPATVLDPLIPIEIEIAPYESRKPPNPDPNALYRPPRFSRA